MKKPKEIKQLKNNYIYTKFHSIMKTKILLTLLAISSFAANAQNDNPYAIFGHKTNVVYETKVKDFFIILLKRILQVYINISSLVSNQ